jgi:Rieske Fe-S protein
VFRGAPAPTNLRVPPYAFVAEAGLVIGEDKAAKGA